MEIYLIRHTKPDVAEGVCYGQADLALEVGWENEVMEIKKNLPDLDKVFSSPLKRCKLMADELHTEVFVDDRLMELNFGSWERTKWEDIERQALETWMNDYLNEAPPNGETAKELHQRVGDFLEDLIKGIYNNIAIVGHLGAFRSIYAHVKEQSLAHAFQSFNLSYGEIFRIKP